MLVLADKKTIPENTSVAKRPIEGLAKKKKKKKKAFV